MVSDNETTSRSSRASAWWALLFVLSTTRDLPQADCTRATGVCLFDRLSLICILTVLRMWSIPSQSKHLGTDFCWAILYHSSAWYFVLSPKIVNEQIYCCTTNSTHEHARLLELMVVCLRCRAFFQCDSNSSLRVIGLLTCNVSVKIWQ